MTSTQSQSGMAFDGGFVPALRGDFERSDVDFDAVVWSLLRAEPYVIDPVSRVLLDAVDGIATIDEIGQDVSEVVGVSPEAADLRVRESLDLFDTAGLLMTSEGRDQSDLQRELFLTPPNT